METWSSSCLDEDGLGQRMQERQERQPLAQGGTLKGNVWLGDVVGTGSPVPRPICPPQIERHGGSLGSEHRIRGSGTLHMIVHGEGASAPAPSSGCSARNMEVCVPRKPSLSRAMSCATHQVSYYVSERTDPYSSLVWLYFQVDMAEPV